jgi:hypothetical protein
LCINLVLIKELQLNMFTASSCPSSGATTAVEASGLPLERGGSGAVGRGRADQVYYLSFKYSSTCLGHPYAHHQELNNCSSSL